MNDKTMPAPAAAALAAANERQDGQLPPDFKYTISRSSDNYILAHVYVVSRHRQLKWKEGTYGEAPDVDTEYWWISKDGWPDLSTVSEIKIEVSRFDYNVKQDFPWENKSPDFSCRVDDGLYWSSTPKTYESSAQSYYYSSSSSSVNARFTLQLVSKQIPNSSRYSWVGVQWWRPGERDPFGSFQPPYGVLNFSEGTTTLTKQSGPPIGEYARVSR